MMNHIPDAPYYVLAKFPEGYHVGCAETKRRAVAMHVDAVRDGATYSLIGVTKPEMRGDRIHIRPHVPPPLPRIDEQALSELGLPKPIRKGSR